MKKLCFIFILFSLNLTAQNQNQWTWVQGSDIPDDTSLEFGLIGLEDALNWPAGRLDYSGVVDSTGKFWIFGGSDGYYTQPNLNSLWVYNPDNNNFNFKKGSLYQYGQEYSKGVGISHYRNTPSYRTSSQMWRDAQNNIWLFSGDTENNLNDIWKYNIEEGNWTKIKAASEGGDAIFGVKGVPDIANSAPGMAAATTWTDNNGNLWMFGGYPRNSMVTTGCYNALWKYNIQTNTWIWMSGSDHVNIFGSYGILGQESSLNHPGARAFASGWTDSSGNLWLFGGKGPITLGVDGSVTGTRRFNDIWKYNTSTNLWTWVKGDNAGGENIATMGTEDIANRPLGNDAAIANWKDDAGNFWMFGNTKDQLWKYNPLTNNWTFVKGNTGSSSTIQAIYGTQGIGSINSTPGSRKNTVGFKAANGDFYIFSGNKDYYSALFDMWRYNIATNTWTWIKGCGTYDCEVIAKVTGRQDEEVKPLIRTNVGPKWTDNEGNLWMYSRNDTPDTHMWKFNAQENNWQWIKGSFSRYIMPENYGIQGTEADTNYPGERNRSQQWIDLQGNLWMYSGSHAFNGQYKSDLWEYNITTNNWIWMHGTDVNGMQPAVYGTQGVAAPANNPGTRLESATWVDDSGIFWLFGGTGQSVSSSGFLNDLWKYNVFTNQWTWMKGSQTVNAGEVNAGIGVANATNTPAAGTRPALTWKDNNDNLWMFKEGDVWKYAIGLNMWTKIKASANTNYGTMGVASATNSPGKREYSAIWKENNGDLLLFGGNLIYQGDNYCADFWRYSVASNMWTWTGGTKAEDFPANYGTKGETSYTNTPGTRKKAISWSDAEGNRYLYGGQGFTGDQYQYTFSDVWMSNGKFNTISGRIKFDSQNNGCSDADSAAANIKVNITGTTSGFVFTDKQGYYTIFANEGAVTVTPENPYFASNPVSQTFNFSGFQNTASQDFCLTSQGQQTDIEVEILPITEARPGFDAKYKIVYTNKGNTVLSGQLQFEYDDAILDYISAVAPPAEQSVGILKWSYSNLMPFESKEILITLNVNTPMETPAVNSEDILSYTVTAPLNGDIYDDNNTFLLSQEVVNSLDPNDKTCLQGEQILETKIGDYVTYMIRFENTGTASAVNVVVKDAIDTSKFDITTLQPVSASHNFRMEVTQDNVVSFNFMGISLDFGENNPSKHGYMAFKIKTLATLEPGDVFSNKADIYFDYNFPVITNLYSTQVGEEIASISNPDIVDFSYYPNPVENVLYLSTNIQFDRASVYDVSGRIVFDTSAESNSVDLQGVTKGVYYIKFTSEMGSKTIKIIKQ